MIEVYEFYGDLRVEIDTVRKDYLRYFKNEYEAICNTNNEQFNAEDKSTIRLSIVENLPAVRSRGDIYRKVKFKNLFNIEYLICGIESNNVLIYFKGNIVDRLYLKSISVFAQCELLEPIMYAKFLEKGRILFHAAGVSTANYAAIFAAKGGGGKTTLCTRLCTNGYSFLGDDLLLVNPEKNMIYPYPRPLHLFAYNIKNVPNSFNKIIVMLKIYIKDMIRVVLQQISKREILISTRVKIQDVYPDIMMGVPVKIEKLYFLKSSGELINQVTIDNNNINKISAEIINSFDLNKSLSKIVENDKPEYLRDIIEIEINLMCDLLKKVKTITYVDTRRQSIEDIMTHVNE